MPLKNFLNKLLILLFLISIFIIPNSVFAYSSKIVVGGQNIGIQVKSSGVLVVGFYSVNNTYPGKEADLKVGDRIIKINDTDIHVISDLTSSIKDGESALEITFIRDNKTLITTLNIYKDSNDVYKTGLYVKDSIIGIGTLTFIDPNNNYFGALGHEITEKSTGKKFEIKNGTIFESDVTGIEKSFRNAPGEKRATYLMKNELGTILKNKKTGIYGIYNSNYNKSSLIEVADPSEIKVGEAYFRTVITGDTIEEFKINILKVNLNENTKNIYFEITDKNLLERTNGVVQGMSGSPIIQNNKIIGAVTHVVVDDSTKGYGIFITTMLKEIEN